MNVNAQKFQSLYALVGNRWHGGTIGGHSLSHAHSGVPAPSEREPGFGAYHSMCRSETVGVRAIFIAPTKLRGGEIPPFIGRHSLSLAFARQLPQRGSREWAVPFIVPPKNRNVAGDFHRPYERRLPFIVPPQSVTKNSFFGLPVGGGIGRRSGPRRTFLG